jgi:chorismate mutase / prephenate dehydratase
MTNERQDATRRSDQPIANPQEPEKMAIDLFESDRQLLAWSKQRLELINRWSKASRTGQAPAPPTLWEQFQQAENLASKERPANFSEEASTHLIRSAIGATYYSVTPPPTVVYLGPMYSYSYLASAKYFSESANLAPVGTIAAVFEEIINKQANFGVVPIENSTDGRIVDTITMFAKSPVRICGEILLPIHHCLLGRCSRAEVREVYSKPQAISQCRNWLSQHLPDAKLVEIASTTAAAKLAAEKHSVAAIASVEAGTHYGLNVIQADIEDNRDNITRFAILGNQKPARTGNDKTSIMMQIPHRSGALAEAMQLLSSNRVNLTWIESFPIPGNNNEYLFFIEIEGHQEDPNVANGLEHLSKHTLRLEILGSYPRGRGKV